MSLNWEIPVAMTLAFNLLKKAQVDSKYLFLLQQLPSYKTEAVVGAIVMSEGQLCTLDIYSPCSSAAKPSISF